MVVAKKNLPIHRFLLYIGTLIVAACGLTLLLSSCSESFAEREAKLHKEVPVRFAIEIVPYGANVDITRNSSAAEAETVLIPLNNDSFLELSLEPDEYQEPRTRASALEIDGTAVLLAAYKSGVLVDTAIYTVDGSDLARSTDWALPADAYTFIAFTYIGATETALTAQAAHIFPPLLDSIPKLLPASAPLYGMLENRSISITNSTVVIPVTNVFARISKVIATPASTAFPIDQIQEIAIVTTSANLKIPLKLDAGAVSKGDTIVTYPIIKAWTTDADGYTKFVLDTCLVYPGEGLVVNIVDLTLIDSDADKRPVSGAVYFLSALKSGVSYTLKITVTKPDGVLDPIEHTFVGAFWKANEIGERIIRITDFYDRSSIFPPALSGPWTAAVSWYDINQWDFARGDGILLSPEKLDNASLTARGITWNAATENPNTPANGPEAHPVLTGSTTLNGTVTTNHEIIFRIGLQKTGTAGTNKSANWTYNPTPVNAKNGPARYAVVSVFYGPDKGLIHKIFLRQGEGDDYIPGNNSGVRWSPYNLGDVSNAADYPNRFVLFPTQAGYFYQWNNMSRTPFHPINPPNTTPGSWNNATGGSNGLESPPGSICPTGYTVPFNANLSALTAQTNWISGYYADGWFDRRAINHSVTWGAFDNGYGHSYAANWWSDQAVSTYNTNYGEARNRTVAYAGTLIYSSSLTNPNASIFFPTPGYRFGVDYTGFGPGGSSVNGALHLAGRVGYYWSRSEDEGWGSGTDERAYALRLFNDPWHSNPPYVYGLPRMSGFSIRCVILIP